MQASVGSPYEVQRAEFDWWSLQFRSRSKCAMRPKYSIRPSLSKGYKHVKSESSAVIQDINITVNIQLR
jgi:hypothetical protein